MPHITEYVTPIVNFKKSTRSSYLPIQTENTSHANSKTPSIYTQTAPGLTPKQVGKYSRLNWTLMSHFAYQITVVFAKQK